MMVHGFMGCCYYHELLLCFGNYRLSLLRMLYVGRIGLRLRLGREG